MSVWDMIQEAREWLAGSGAPEEQTSGRSPHGGSKALRWADDQYLRRNCRRDLLDAAKLLQEQVTIPHGVLSVFRDARDGEGSGY